jgi:outer membrane autotransporter protein
MKNWILQPFASFQYSRLCENAYRESGSSGLNLVYDDQETDALISDVGVRLTTPYEEAGWIFIPEISLAWRHNYDVDSRNITVRFEDVPATSFTTESRDIDQNGILIGAGIMLLSKSGFSMHVRYDGERRGDFKASQLSGGLRYEF